MSDCCDPKEISKIKNDLNNHDGLICFCFKKSKMELVKAIEQGQQSLFLDDIKLKMKTLGCSCEKMNPSGKCCLNDVQEFINNS